MADAERVKTFECFFDHGGAITIEWDGRDDRGRPVSTAVYFVRLVAGDYQMTKKAVMLK